MLPGDFQLGQVLSRRVSYIWEGQPVPNCYIYPLKGHDCLTPELQSYIWEGQPVPNCYIYPLKGHDCLTLELQGLRERRPPCHKL